MLKDTMDIFYFTLLHCFFLYEIETFTRSNRSTYYTVEIKIVGGSPE
jgi:hypothetical protein